MSPLIREPPIHLDGKASVTKYGILVNEIELSSYPGTQLPREEFRIQDHDEEELLNNALKPSHLEECLPRRDSTQAKGNWKPLTLRAPILGSFILTSLSIIVFLEVLSRRSLEKSNGGGVGFPSEDSTIPPAISFGFLYLPTILAVFYSMVWSWVDLDVKRLEPWFQLSTTDGASAENSLLLQYPFDFLPFIPITAALRRHWSVFFAGIVMLMIFWVVTPLQSAIFNNGIVNRLSDINFGTSAELTSLPLQTTSLSANFLNTAYGITWLGQKLPSFTAFDFAFLPFRPVTKSGELVMSDSPGTWSTTVEAFNTNLTCSPAEVSLSDVTYTFSNGKGCTLAGVEMEASAEYTIYYIGYYDNPQSDWALQNPNCSASFANTFLAIWTSTSSSNMTALFCETSYTSQAMYVTVNASTQSVVSGFSTGVIDPSTDLSTIFNISNFEYLLATGVPATSQRGNLLDTVIVQQDSHLLNYSISWPSTNMVGFAVGLNTQSLDSLQDPLELGRFFEKAHQLLFSAAFSTLTTFESTSIPNTTRAGLLQDNQEAIILVRPIAIAVEVALGLIVIFTCCLWGFAHSRLNSLPYDPSSIADIMSLAPCEDEILEDGILSTTKLEQVLSCNKYYLCASESGPTAIRSRPLDSKYQPKYQSQFQASGKKLSQETFSPIRPLELGAVFGGAFIFIMLSALAGLMSLYFWSQRNGGIALPSTNTVVRSIVENYAPTTLATLIEPVWTILNRLLCLLQPFEELRRGRAKASRSVDAKYTSLPPQLSFWRALTARHFLLAAVCLVAVSSNVLSVSLSTLMNEDPATINVKISSGQEFSPRFNGTPIFDPAISGDYSDHFYIAMSNITSGTSLPAWVDTNFFYFPFKLSSNASTPDPTGELQGFSGSTIGLGANVTCTRFPSPDGIDTLEFEVNTNGSSIQLSTTHLTQNGTKITCVHPLTAGHDSNETTVNIGAFEEGALALEIVQNMQPASGIDDGGFCGAMLFIGWVRATAEPANRNITSTFLSCTQELLVAEFEVVVDETGHVMTSNRTSEFAKDLSQYFTPNATIRNDTFFSGPIQNGTDLFQESTDLIAQFAPDGFEWHNDSFASDWMNSLLGILLNSTSLVDPGVEVPDAKIVEPLVEGLYQELFALLLILNAPHMFAAAENSIDPKASAIFVVTRIFISPTMFAVSVAVFALHILVAILYYTHRPQRFLPRMPTSIASVIAFGSASRAMKDFKTRDREKSNPKNQQYGYGRFLGTDGKTHVGIEHQRYVVPLESKNPEVKRRKWKLWVKEDEKQPKTWI